MKKTMAYLTVALVLAVVVEAEFISAQRDQLSAYEHMTTPYQMVLHENGTNRTVNVNP